MAFTEFYCQNTADNRNAGSTNSDTPAYASINGNWNNTTRIFTPSDGSNPSSFIAVGDFCSVYADAATLAAFVALVTAVTTTTVTLSGTFFIGTNPATLATGMSLRAGGAWKGPVAGTNWPLPNITNVLRGTADLLPRVNMKGNPTGYSLGTIDYNPNSAITNSNQFVTVEGYLNTPGDGGFAVLDFGNGGGGMSQQGTGSIMKNLIVQRIGTTGTNAFTVAVGGLAYRCIGRKLQATGMGMNAGALAVECEIWDWDNGQSNIHAFSLNAGSVCIRCYAHDPCVSAGGFGVGNPAGFLCNANGGVCISCVALRCATAFQSSIPAAGASCWFFNCDAIASVGHGFNANAFSASHMYFENCNFFKNALFGVNILNTGRTTLRATLINCASGTGSMANGSGRHTDFNIVDVNPVIYPPGEHPWKSYAGRDWRVVHPLSAAGRGRGKFNASPLVIGGLPVGAYPQNFETENNMAGIGANLYVPPWKNNFDSPTQMIV